MLLPIAISSNVWIGTSEPINWEKIQVKRLLHVCHGGEYLQHTCECMNRAIYAYKGRHM